MKKLVAWLLVCLMVVSSLPIAAFAASVDEDLCPGLGEEHYYYPDDQDRSNCSAEKVYGPECGTEGTAGYECKVCGTNFTTTENFTSKTPHPEVLPEGDEYPETVKLISAGKKANCATGEAGVAPSYKCTVCLKTWGGKTIEVHEELDHVTELIIDGEVYYAEGVCDDCGYAEITNNTDKTDWLNHEWSKTPVITELPTCAKYGKAVYTCTDPECDANPSKPGYQPATKEVAILKTACEKLLFVDKVDPTCEKDGVKAHYECQAEKCGRIYDENKVELKEYEKEVDKKKVTVTIDEQLNIPKYDHDLSEVGMTDAHIGHYAHLEGACEETAETAKYDWKIVELYKDTTKDECGKFKRTCEICEKEYERELDHDYADAVIDPLLNCDAEGSKKETCKLCDETKESVRGHKLTKIADLAKPTCLMDGYAELQHCEYCKRRIPVAYMASQLKWNDADKEDYKVLIKDAEFGVDAGSFGYVDWDGNGKFEGLELENRFRVDENGKCNALKHVETYVQTNDKDPANLIVKSYCNTALDYMIVKCANGEYCPLADDVTSWTDDNGTADTADDVVYSLVKEYIGTTIGDGKGVDNFMHILIIEKDIDGEQTNHESYGKPDSPFKYADYLKQDTAEKKAAYIAKWFWFAPAPGSVGSWAVQNAPTCTEPGDWAAYCNCCNENVSGPIAAMGHNYVASLYDTDEDKEGIQPADDKHWWKCEHCGQFDPDVSPDETKPHTYDATKEVHNNSCVEITVEKNGITYKIAANFKYNICTGCGYVNITDDTAFNYNYKYGSVEDDDETEEDESMTAYEHAASIHKGIAAEKDYIKTIDCDEAGAYRTYACTDCNQMVFVLNEAHLFLDGDKVITSTNAACGVEYTCFYCGEKKTFHKEHNFKVYTPFTAPSCPIDLDGDGLYDKEGETDGTGNLPYWTCGNGNGCKFVKYIDKFGENGYTIADGETYKSESKLPALKHENVILDSEEANGCTGITYDHVGCAFCNRVEAKSVKCANITAILEDLADDDNPITYVDWNATWTEDADWLDDATNTDDISKILASGEYIMNFAMGAHKNAAGESFTSICDAAIKGITDTKCVIEGCAGVAGHLPFSGDPADKTCTGYVCDRCETVIEDATVAGDHVFGAYEAKNGTFAATGDVFVEYDPTSDNPAVVITPEKNYIVCKYCGTEKEVTLDTKAEIEYTIEVAPLYGTEYTVGSTVVLTVKVISNAPVSIAANQVSICYTSDVVELYDYKAADGSPFTTVTAGKKIIDPTITDGADIGNTLVVSATADGKNTVVNGEAVVAQLYFTIHAGMNESVEKFDFASSITGAFVVVPAGIEAPGAAEALLGETFASNENQDTAEEFVGFATKYDEENSSVEFDAVQALDLNEDGDLNSLDLTIGLQLDAFTYDARFDIDGDGIVSAADIQDVLDYIAGTKSAWDLYVTGLPTHVTDEINANNTVVTP